MNDNSAEDLHAAPPAPDGWYPHPAQPDLERFWDGRSWTSERSNGKPAPTQVSAADADRNELDAIVASANTLPKRRLGKHDRWALAITGFVFAGVVAFGVVVSVAGHGSDDSPPDAATQRQINKALGVDDGPKIPSGFHDLGNGLAYKWTTDDHEVGSSVECDYGSSCSFMEVFATEDCPSDVFVAVNSVDDSDVVVDDTNDSLPALRAGQTGELEFDFTDGGGYTQIASSSCL